MRQELVTAPQTFRNILIDAVKRNVGTDNEIALMFGGGTDASCLAFALMELGIKPHLYTFHLEGIISEDLIAAKKFAEYFKLQHTIVTLNKNPQMLIDDVLTLINRYGCSPFPTTIQCSQPFMHVMPRVSENRIFFGFGIDVPYGTTRFMSQNFRNNVQAYHDRIKLIYFRGRLYQNGCEHLIYHISRDIGKNVKSPYYDPEIENFFLQFSLKDLTLPKLKTKWISVYAFKDYFEMYPMYRQPASYQTNAGVQKWHDDVFLNSIYNTKGYRDVMFVYKYLYKNVFIDDERW